MLFDANCERFGWMRSVRLRLLNYHQRNWKKSKVEEVGKVDGKIELTKWENALSWEGLRHFCGSVQWMNVAYCINCIIPTVRLTDDDDDDDSNCSDRRKRICEKAFIMANGKDSSNKFNLHKNILQIDEDDDVWVDESNKPLINGCEDNWTWNKRHRSQEVILPEPSLRKGTYRRARRTQLTSFYRDVYVQISIVAVYFSLLSSKLE